MAAISLLPDRLSPHNNENSFKYVINCQSKINPTSPETREWLEIKKLIEHSSPDYKLFTGILDKHKDIVVKIGSAKLINEYKIGMLLDSLKLPTFLSYYCNFSCLDDLKSKKNNVSRKYLCKKDGEPITVLLMPYIKMGSIQTYKWGCDNFHIMLNIFKHIIKSLSYARKNMGFVHNDLHFGNVLLQPTRRKNIDYGEFGELEVFGIIPVIMDYDRSIIYETNEPSKPNLYHDFKRIIEGISQDTNVVFRHIEFSSVNNSFYDNAITPIICNKICDAIDKIKIDHLKSERPPILDFSKPFK